MLGATCCSAVLYITNGKWTTLGQDIGICVGWHKLLYTLNCYYTKILHFFLVLNALLNRLSSKCTVSLQFLVSVNLQWHYGNYAPTLQRRCIEICVILWFWYSYWWGRLKGSCWEILCSTECEMWRCKYVWPASLYTFKPINLRYIYIYIYISGNVNIYCDTPWWLLAGRGTKICHEVWSLGTVMQLHTVYSKHKELLQSCYRKLEENPSYGADLAHWTVIFGPVTQHLWGHQLYSKNNSEALFLPWQF